MAAKLDAPPLQTKVKRVAEERLPGKLRELRDQPAAANTVASLVEEYKRKIAADADLEPGSVEYKGYCIAQIGKCWPGFQQLRIGNLRKSHFTDCRNNLARQYSQTRANGCLTVQRELVELAVNHGWIPKGNELLEDCNWVKAKNGKLVMSTYSHITQQHSQERARTLRIMNPAKPAKSSAKQWKQFKKQ